MCYSQGTRLSPTGASRQVSRTLGFRTFGRYAAGVGVCASNDLDLDLSTLNSLSFPSTTVRAAGTSPGFISHRSKRTCINAAVVVPVPLFASSPQVLAMHPPTVADGRLNVSKLYKPPVPMPSEWNLEKIEPGTDNPEKVRPADSRLGTFRPQEIVMSAPQKTPASALPQARPPLPTRFSSSPSKTISAQVSAIPVDPATKLPHMNTSSFPITQHFPVPGPFPGPSTLNQLRSQKSISVLAGA